MALTSAQQVRLAIQDPPTVADTVLIADGRATRFELPHTVHTSASAFVDVGAQWVATGATFSSGMVEFAHRISANSAFRVSYVHTVFSDAEIDDFIDRGNDLLGAQIAAVETLMFDSLKRVSWRAHDGTSYNDTHAQQTLQAMHTKLKRQQMDEAQAILGVYGWHGRAW